MSQAGRGESRERGGGVRDAEEGGTSGGQEGGVRDVRIDWICKVGSFLTSKLLKLDFIYK